jgi:putative selenate reductase
MGRNCVLLQGGIFMSDRFKPLSFRSLLNWILEEYSANQSIFGIHQSMFFIPETRNPFGQDGFFGQHLATPVGPAAGPHTQLAQNIICSWLSGGRFIELKTVQCMDELDIPRPCIDMEDEGYNVEWSQELKLEQSAAEYIHAWVIIHILRRILGFENRLPFGTIFNMSVGYNFDGIHKPSMVHFMNTLRDAGAAIDDIRNDMASDFPEFADIKIPSSLTNNVTLSTMHGCPPDEIERIAAHLINEWNLHTTVKLNPTLLGREVVYDILHKSLGFTDIEIPDAVFENDLGYDRALDLIRSLQHIADGKNLSFGVKLSNTLAMSNHRSALPGEEMYMSGRALYPVTMNLFRKLQETFKGQLRISYSAGADALNIPQILSAGACPVTVATDLLKPGGTGKFLHYLEVLGKAMQLRGVSRVTDLAQESSSNLRRSARSARQDVRYAKGYHPFDLPKVSSKLTFFDCITAPCVEQCAVHQEVPEYARLLSAGRVDEALSVILSRNPLPGVTGHVCTHLCQTRCTRNNYDESVAIRSLKRFAAEHGRTALPAASGVSCQVAVIGSGPSGLAAAAFLACNGIQVTLFEAKDRPGGMLAVAPAFRLPPDIVERDIKRILDLGVQLHLSHPVADPPEKLLSEDFDAVYLAHGFPRSASLQIKGIEGYGVVMALDLLETAARGESCDLGSNVLVIGGGNTAMDAARTAQRLTKNPVTVVYRRSRNEMPAEQEELEDLITEGNQLIELASPEEVILDSGRITGLTCVRNALSEPGKDGRRKPVPIPGSQFQLPADSIIVAVGQQADVTFLDGSAVRLEKNNAVSVNQETGDAYQQCVYAGGDAVRGPAIIIQACADGLRAAQSICRKFDVDFRFPSHPASDFSDTDLQTIKLARIRKSHQQKPAVLPAARRANFDLVEQTFTTNQSMTEASRCLQCAALCDKCVEVCPNRANFAITVDRMSIQVPRLTCRDGELIISGTQPFHICQTRQILHVDDFCNECGNCATFCVHQGKPYLDKPRLFLEEDAFLSESDNAFTIRRNIIRSRSGGVESRLVVDGSVLFFENDLVKITCSQGFDIEFLKLKSPFTGTITLQHAAEMLVIYQGVQRTLPFLLV